MENGFASDGKPETRWDHLNPEFDYVAALQQLFWDSLDGMIITDTDQQVMAVNPAYARITGVPPEDWVGRKPSLIKSGKTPPWVYEEMWSSIRSRGRWLGEVVNQRPDGSQWVSYLSITRLQARDGTPMGYVGVARDITQQKQREEELARRLQEVDYLQETSVRTLAEGAEFRDPDISGHLNRIRQYTALLVEVLCREGRPELQDSWLCTTLVRCSLLHDIGKVGIPEGILLKPSRLLPEEYEVVKLHAQIGWQMLQRADALAAPGVGNRKTFFGIAAEIARHHHERWDGTGYPDGLAGEEIPIGARIVALADVYDALSSRRVYKEPWAAAAVHEYIVNQSGTQFDPAVVRAFLQVRHRFHQVRAGASDQTDPDQPAGWTDQSAQTDPSDQTDKTDWAQGQRTS